MLDPQHFSHLSFCDSHLRATYNAVAVLVYTVQENWSKKKLAGALFIDVKEVFNYISKIQLLKFMINLGIDTNLIV